MSLLQMLLPNAKPLSNDPYSASGVPAPAQSFNQGSPGLGGLMNPFLLAGLSGLANRQNPMQGIQSGLLTAALWKQRADKTEREAELARERSQIAKVRLNLAQSEQDYKVGERERLAAGREALKADPRFAGQEAMIDAGYGDELIRQQLAGPKTEQVYEGNQIVTYQVNPDGTRAKVASAPRWQPQQVQSTETERLYQRYRATKDPAERQELGAMLGLTGGAQVTNEEFDRFNALRDDFRTDTKAFGTVYDNYLQGTQAPPTGAGDISRVFALMKVYDPGSVVGQGEQASAANAGGVPGRVRSLYNELIGGGSLGGKERRDIEDEIHRVYKDRYKGYVETVGQHRRQAERYIPQANWGMYIPTDEQLQAMAPGQPGQAPAPGAIGAPGSGAVSPEDRARIEEYRRKHGINPGLLPTLPQAPRPEMDPLREQLGSRIIR